jgi:hypothetical protein
LKHECCERARNARKPFPSFVPFVAFVIQTPSLPTPSKLETSPLGKPAPDQLHLEAVTSVGRFDQLTPGEQVEGAVQFNGEAAAQGFPADHSPFPLCRQEAQQGQPGGVYLVLLDVSEEEAAVSTEDPSMRIRVGETKGTQPPA